MTGHDRSDQIAKAITDLALRVINEHEPRRHGCLCGAVFGDDIDRRWHLVNSALRAAADAVMPHLDAAVAEARAETAELTEAYESWRKAGTEAFDALRTIWRALGDDRKHMTFGDDPQRVVDEFLAYQQQRDQVRAETAEEIAQGIWDRAHADVVAHPGWMAVQTVVDIARQHGRS